MVVESADLLEFGDLPACSGSGGPSIKRVLVQGKVCYHTVVIINISSQESLQVTGTKYDHMVQEFPPNGTDDTFCVRALPRGPIGGKDFHISERLCRSESVKRDRPTIV
jgi:hypothetical protein